MDFIPQKSRNEDANSRSLSSSPKNESLISFYFFNIHKTHQNASQELKSTKTKAMGEVRVFKIWRLV
mgnify:CR=1 FL=1